MATYICTKKYALNEGRKRTDFQIGDKISEKVFQKLSSVGKSCFEASKRGAKARGSNDTQNGKPLEQKDHYIWLTTYLEFIPRFANIEEGEMTVEQVWLQESIRALDIFQPVLDRKDTTKRGIISRRGEELCANASQLGRQISFDRSAYHAAIADVFNEKKGNRIYSDKTTVLKGIEIDAFRTIARSEVEELTSSVYPSVANRAR